MNLVVDTNVVFSALIAGGKTRELLIAEDVVFSVPEFFFVELTDNRREIQSKTGLDASELDVLLDLVLEQLSVVPRSEFEDWLPQARKLIAETDPDDVPFLALALALDAGLWTDDTHFREQDAVTVWRTHELVERWE